MTTIASNLKEIAADSNVHLEGVGSDAFVGEKIFVANGRLYGVAGEDCDGSILAIEWLQSGGAPDFRPAAAGADWTLLELSPLGIAVYNTQLERETCHERVLAIGSGRKVAMYCMKYLKMSPREAVREACKVDDWSKPPIFYASLADPVVRRLTEKRKRK